MKTGIISGLPMDAYLNMEAVSASLLRAIEPPGCPKAAWYESWLNAERASATNKEMDAGTVAHGILLEGSEAGIEVIDPNDHPAEKTGAIPLGWTNKSIKAARDATRQAGKIPILLDDYGDIKDMVGMAREYIESVKADEPAIWQAFQPDGGESEVTMVWQEGATACRIRPDRLSTDRKLIVDYKSGKTSPEPGLWGRTQMVKMGYYMAAAFYQRGVNALCGAAPAYVWLVQSQDPPFLCSLVGLDPHAADLGARKIEHALALWAQCAAAGKWPGYPTKVAYPEIPNWEESAWMEQQSDTDADGIPYDVKSIWEKA